MNIQLRIVLRLCFTISTFIDRVYKDNIIDSKLKKNMLRKIIKLINFIYKQRDGVSLGFSFGHILANGTMIELQKNIYILQSLIKSGDLKIAPPKPLFPHSKNQTLFNVSWLQGELHSKNKS